MIVFVMIVVDILSRFRGRSGVGDGAVSEPVVTDRLIFDLPRRNLAFIGRESLLAGLEKTLGQRRTAAVQALHGMGGVGKTHLVTEYAYRHKTDYRLIAFVNAERADLIPAAFVELGARMGLPPKDDMLAAVDQVRANLHQWSPWLLIFDNAEKPSDLTRFLPPHDGHVLITTRNAGWTSLGGILEIDIFSRAESRALLSKRVKGISQRAANDIASMLGDLPLALEQAAGYIGQTSIDPTKYTDLLKLWFSPMLQRGDVPDRPGETVATLWRISMDKLHDRHPHAVQLLRIIAVLAPDPIPLDLFTNNATADALGPELAAHVINPVHWNDTIGTITGFGLVRRNDDSIVMHRLVSAAVRAGMNPAYELPTAQKHALRLLRADLPGRVRETPENRARWVHLFPHILSAVDTEIPDVRDKQIWLLERAASPHNRLWADGDPDQVPERVAKLVNLTETIFGEDDIKVAERLTNLGNVLLGLGQTDQAIAAFRRAASIIIRVQGSQSVATGQALLAIGVELMKGPQRSAAAEFLRPASDALEAASREDHSLSQAAQVARNLIEQVT